jgi:hypothetical protein
VIGAAAVEAIADWLPHLSVDALRWIVGGGLSLGIALAVGTLIVWIWLDRKRNRIGW